MAFREPVDSQSQWLGAFRRRCSLVGEGGHVSAGTGLVLWRRDEERRRRVVWHTPRARDRGFGGLRYRRACLYELSRLGVHLHGSPDGRDSFRRGLRLLFRWYACFI